MYDNRKDKKASEKVSNILHLIKCDLSQHIIKFKLGACKEFQKFSLD